MLRSILAVIPTMLLVQSVIGGLTATVDATALSNLTQVLSQVLDILQTQNDIAKPTNEKPQPTSATTELTTPTTTTETTTTTPNTTTTVAVPLAVMLQSSSSDNKTLNKAEAGAIMQLLGQLGLGSLGSSLLGLSSATTQTPINTTEPNANSTSNSTGPSNSTSTNSTIAANATTAGVTVAPSLLSLMSLTTKAAVCDVGAVCNMLKPCPSPCTCSNVQNPKITGRCVKGVIIVNPFGMFG